MVEKLEEEASINRFWHII